MVMLCGNGGSAADCGHVVGELMKGFLLPRRIDNDREARLRHVLGAEVDKLALCLQDGVRAVSLAEPTALLSAIANDLSPEMVFAQQVNVLGRAGDVLMAFSTSGNAVNVIRALQVARAIGVTTIGFTGANNGNMECWCDIVFRVPETETPRIQELHLPLYHAICEMVELQLFGEPVCITAGGNRR
jgi:D-sedoheptulose 7-phosphate isomerase